MPGRTVVNVGDLTMDLARREFRLGGEELRLTKTEFNLLREFVTHADKVLTYEHLLDAVWGDGYDDPRAVHVHISNLRRKLERLPASGCGIQAIPGVGYRLREPDRPRPLGILGESLAVPAVS